MIIKSIRDAGKTLTYPNGCYEVVIEFESPQELPNFGDGWGLGDFGVCKTYQGVKTPNDPSTFSGVVAYYDGKPNLNVATL